MRTPRERRNAGVPDSEGGRELVFTMGELFQQLPLGVQRAYVALVRYQLGQPRPTGLRVVGFTECCKRIGISRRHGEKLLAAHRFPIPEMPSLATGRIAWRRFSTHDIDEYVRNAATADVRVRRR